MIYLPQPGYAARQRALFRDGRPATPAVPVHIQKAKHKARIRIELKELGVSWWGMLWQEIRVLHKVLHDSEQLGAVVYGHTYEGTALLVATDRRVLFLDKTPLYFKSDELAYDMVAGINYGQSALWATIVLRTRIRDYKVRTMNLVCAGRFRHFIETNCLEPRFLRDPW